MQTMILTDGAGPEGVAACELAHSLAVQVAREILAPRFKEVDPEVWEEFFICLLFDLLAASFPGVGKDGALFISDELRRLVDANFEAVMAHRAAGSPALQ